ncbi:hypothetical protein [Dickeya zeae]|uniref:hypothetical protein n=1 Tax=Dickeya zeae TaxID=204042 RepID=UPI0032C13E69
MASKQLADALDVPLAFFYTADDQLAELMLAFSVASPERKVEILALVKTTK